MFFTTINKVKLTGPSDLFFDVHHWTNIQNINTITINYHTKMLLIIFFKKLLSKWWALLAFLPSLYDTNSAYLSSNLPAQYQDLKIGPIFSNAIIGLTLLFAFYQVWEEEYKLRLGLEAKITEQEKRIPKYEPIVTIANEVKFDHVLISFDSEYEWLTKKQFELVILTTPKKITNDNSLASFMNSYDAIFADQRKEYLLELQEYDSQLLKFKKELCDQIENYKVFKVSLKVQNIGSIFDENINIIIKSDKFNFYEPYQLTENILPTIPDRPRDPTKMPNFGPLGISYRESEFSDYFEMDHEIKYGAKLIDPDYKQVHKISPNLIEVELNKLASHQTADLVIRDLLIRVDKSCEKIDFDFEIKSKNTQQPLIYTVSLNLPTIDISSNDMA